MADVGVNSVTGMKISGSWCRVYTIRELFCYRHPVRGHIVKKDYSRMSIMTLGRVPKNEEALEKMIEAQKRKIERYNTTVTADGDLPIAEWWWEDPPK